MYSPETLGEKLMFTASWVEAHVGDRRRAATAFVLLLRHESGSEVPLLVTCRHVLSGASALVVRFHRAEPGGSWVQGGSLVWTLQFQPDDLPWVGHPNPDVDVAVLPLAEVFDAFKATGAVQLYAAVTPDLFADETALRSIDVGDEVRFIGYPDGRLDPTTGLAMTRIARAATPPSIDHRGQPLFLLDGSVFPGSSGSPVFLVQPGVRIQGPALVFGRGVLRFLGVVSGLWVRAVRGKLSLPGSQVETESEEALDVGVVFKALTVMETADAFLARRGATRVGDIVTGG